MAPVRCSQGFHKERAQHRPQCSMILTIPGVPNSWSLLYRKPVLALRASSGAAGCVKTCRAVSCRIPVSQRTIHTSVYIYIYRYTCMHIDIYMYAYMYIHIYIYICMYACIHAGLCRKNKSLKVLRVEHYRDPRCGWCIVRALRNGLRYWKLENSLQECDGTRYAVSAL